MTIPKELAERLAHTEYVVGSDEAGFGAWAGPLFVVSVCVHRDWTPPQGLTDSKKLTEARREALLLKLLDDPKVQHVVEVVEPPDIDRTGVYQANVAAHKAAHRGFDPEWGLHIADGNLDLGLDIESLPKADALVPAVSAASIFAKVLRDRWMVLLGKEFPGYGFEVHRGYGVPAHQAALLKLGPCKAHRMSYAPVAAARKGLPQPGSSVLDMLADLPQE